MHPIVYKCNRTIGLWLEVRPWYTIHTKKLPYRPFNFPVLCEEWSIHFQFLVNLQICSHSLLNLSGPQIILLRTWKLQLLVGKLIMEQFYPTSVALVRQMPLPYLLLFPVIVLFRYFLINFMRKIHSCSNKKKRLVTDFFASWIWAQNNLGKATQKFDTTDILQILNGSKVLDLLSLRIAFQWQFQKCEGSITTSRIRNFIRVVKYNFSFSNKGDRQKLLAWGVQKYLWCLW